MRPPVRSAGALTLAAAVCLAGCYERSDYVLTPTLVQTLLTLASVNGAATLTADGFSRLGLVARISPKADADRRVVVFTTSAGTLVGGTAVNGTAEVPADADGAAFIELESSQRVETAVVRAQVKGVEGLTTTLAIAFVAASPDEVIRFVAFPAAPVPADGATLSTFTVSVSPAIPPESRQVTFTATKGTFAGGATVTPDAGNTASADLISPTEITTGRVRATVNGVSREVTVGFTRAFATFVSLVASQFTVKSDGSDSATLTATFTRDVGTVTANPPVVWRATRGGSELPAALFQNLAVTTQGGVPVATAVFRGNATTAGPVAVSVAIEGSAVTGTVDLEVVDP